jgi:DNA-directed RNA polymerase specialized sigma24 family protein
MLGSIEDVDNAVQEPLLRAWARIDSFAGPA